MSMDAATRAALEGSIKKWQAIVDGTGYDNGPFNCPLCAIFQAGDRNCDGCPVYARTKLAGCWGTPYYTKWYFVQGKEDCRGRATTPELKAAAQAELDFLISLRPAEAKP